ncbi:MAG TPA: 2-oxoacid:acceptor oxidoreductase subunit alpha [Actinomycetota bacterium]|nr:2-oxoacid:acceptor oxidoreductase subunit alpha [Actinomycetota bacterium]
MTTKSVESISRVVIRFAGDSGDGMQLTGERFTNATAILGNDLATLPDFPAEIRAPAGSLAGVSGFQIHFSDQEILTPGDQPNVLVAMNPAGLRTNIGDLLSGGILIVNSDAFVDKNLERAGYATNPLADGTLDAYQVYEVPMTTMTLTATKDIEGITKKDAERAKNMFALGLVSWMYGRPIEVTLGWLEKRFAGRPGILEANVRAFKAGHAFGETAELFAHQFQVSPATYAPGRYRNITGSTALSWGLIAASQCSNLPLFYASYPITPASEILHELSKHKNFGVRTLQSEDEIAAACAAVGAAFGGHLGVTATSGPGVDLKSETISLGVVLELPMIIIDVQRAGPSTGMPTKQEAADLLLAMYGRHGESPVPIIAPYTPAQCFEAAIEAARIALKYRTPVFILADTFLANSSEPWRLPDVESLPDIGVPFTTEANHDGQFWPYLRDENLARPWAVPGTPGLEHRIGGLEKQDGTGNVSYDPVNHEYMTRIRAAKIAKIADDIPSLEVDDPSGDAELLVLGWGSTYGAIRAACANVRAQGKSVAHAHLLHLNPFPKNTGDVLRAYPRVLVPENNMGQLVKMVRSEFLVDAKSYSKMQGLPFRAADIETEILKRV